MSSGGGLRHAGDEDNFVVVPRPTIRDERLSFRARGLLTFILDLPSGWEIKATWLATQATEGEEAIYSALKELKTFGYYRVERRRGPNGKFVSGTAISKRPKRSWAAQYAEEVEARAERRRVAVPVVDVLEDGTVIEEDGQVVLTESDEANTPADLAEAGNGEAPKGLAGNGEPPSSTEERARRRETEGDSSSVSHQSNAGARARPAPPRLAELDPLPPPPPMGITRTKRTEKEWRALREKLAHPPRDPAPELPEEERRGLTG